VVCGLLDWIFLPQSVDDDWSEEDNKPVAKYEEGEVILDWYPESSKDLTLLKYVDLVVHSYWFSRYDKVYIFKKDTDGWWYGEHKGVYGRMPARHIRLNSEKPPEMNDATKEMMFGSSSK
jgi:hypothetical protein